jgi:hypothetical protein
MKQQAEVNDNLSLSSAAGVMCAAGMNDPSIGDKETIALLVIKLKRDRIPHYRNTAARSTFAGARGTESKAG